MRNIHWVLYPQRSKVLFLGLLILWGGTLCRTLSAQTDQSDALWSRIVTHLDQPNVDTSYQFIVDEIMAHCSSDAYCLLLSYDTIRTKLEQKFKLAAAVRVTKELISIAAQQGLTEKMAQGHYDLSRYFDALQEARSAVLHLDHSLHYFELCGNKRKIIKCKFWRLKLTSPDGRIDHAQNDRLEALVHEAIAEKDSALAGYILTHLFHTTIAVISPEKCKSYFALFERIMNPDTKVRLERMHWGDFWNIKGIFEQRNGDHQIAKTYFEKALAIFEHIEDPWRALNTTLYLVETDWLLGHREKAKTGLEKALKKSTLLHSDDLIVKYFKIASTIAEAEGRHKDALDYLKKMYATQERINETGDKKIADNYYLEIENNTKSLKLNLRNQQLRYTTTTVVLVMLLAVGLLIGFYQQRKSRRELAAQHALIQAQASQLQSLDAAKSRFFANVSHELRTPLTLLTSPINTLLKEHKLSERQAQLLQIAAHSGQQLGQLINEILDLRKLETGKMTLSTEPTELRSWFQTYFAQFESLADQKQIDYKVALEVPDHIIADIDREKCRQVLFNLLSNAFKFTPESGRIEAVVNIPENTLQLLITNSGPGIHPDDLPHVFDRYFQSGRPDKPTEGGTGIGLALCREYAHLFGGTISAESTPDINTQFHLVFPLHLSRAEAWDAAHLPVTLSSIAPAEDLTETASMPSTPAAKKATLLIVEDNPDLRNYIRLILKDKYTVITAEHGQAALQHLMKHVGNTMNRLQDADIIPSSSLPDLILSDLMMPVMDGYQLLERLKSVDATRHIPVILLTARAEAQDKLKALRIGVDDYLTKPFDEEELLVRIENLLKNQAARRTAVETPENQADETASASLLSQPDREWLESFEEYVQKHYASDLLSVSSLAHTFAMSESTLLRQLKRLSGLSPLQYILEVRLHEARKLLENRSFNSIAQVASKVGYDDARSFARSFKQRFGKLPSEIMEA